MDGVLVDFELGMMLMFNQFMNSYNFENETSKINKYYARLSQDLGNNFRLTTGGNLRQMKTKSVGLKNITYALVSKNPGLFFQNLPVLDDGIKDLWTYLNNTGRNVSLLTAGISGPPYLPTAEVGKRLWADKNLNPKYQELICVPAENKKDYAVTDGTPNILIDDRADTIDSWNLAGGFGILHIPKNSEITISILKEMGV